MALRSVCVFCGSSMGARPEYAAAAQSLGQLVASRGITLVYGGSNVGLMRVIADACMSAGGYVIGVMPDFMAGREVAHTSISDLRIVGSMHERKALMAELSDAFIALPGGFGTFDELFEILTWRMLQLHEKPLGFLNVARYYDPLLRLADHTVAEGFLRPAFRETLLHDEDPLRLLEALGGRMAALSTSGPVADF